MKTRGDMIADKPLADIGGKGLFVKEVDAALLDGRIDIAVHSLKDIPSKLAEGVELRAFLPRDDPRDVLVLPLGLEEADGSKPIGCSGGRRRVQARRLFPGREIRLIRGNVLTRLSKLDTGGYGALILAAASLLRLKLDGRIGRFFGPDEMVPAAGQGIIAVCARAGCGADYLAALDDADSRVSAFAERAFVRALDGGCGAPIAAFSERSGATITLRGLYAEAESEEGGFVTGSLTGAADKPEELGRRLAARLLTDYCAARGVSKGKVTLVGAGPGDAGLLTLKGAAALDKAEVVLYDNLAGRGVLARIPASAASVYVGKEAGRHSLPQADINFLLLRHAAEGRNTVRLKGGDPFLFARGAEELDLLREAGIPFEVIPGVPSALAVPAYAGIPATRRGLCSAVHIVTAHQQDGGQAGGIDYEALVRSGGTLVFLMGVSALGAIRKGLLNAGLPGATPAAVIERGSTAKQRKVVSDIENICRDAADAHLASPAVTIAGEAAAVGRELSWFERKPLFGLRIAVTRPADRASALSALLADEGAEVIEIPAIRTAPLADCGELRRELEALGRNEGKLAGGGRTWFAFTSPFGADAFFERLLSYGLDARVLGGTRFAAIGRATAEALLRHGIIADLVPDVHSGAALGALLAAALTKADRVILPRSAIAGAELPNALAAAGLPFTCIAVYETLTAPRQNDPHLLDMLTEGLDWVAFTSASAAAGFMRIAGRERCRAMREHGVKALCIGAKTEEAARKAGFETLTARNATLEDMAEALVRFAQ
jgi:uroporphyrinogen III methyltransferase/synthase